MNLFFWKVFEWKESFQNSKRGEENTSTPIPEFFFLACCYSQPSFYCWISNRISRHQSFKALNNTFGPFFHSVKECMVNMDVGWYIEEKRKKVWDVQVCCSIVNIGAFLKFSSSNNFKVQLFWEGHKNLKKNLPLYFDLT